LCVRDFSVIASRADGRRGVPDSLFVLTVKACLNRDRFLVTVRLAPFHHLNRNMKNGMIPHNLFLFKKEMRDNGGTRRHDGQTR
jgi:hypothetical protein